MQRNDSRALFVGITEISSRKEYEIFQKEKEKECHVSSFPLVGRTSFLGICENMVLGHLHLKTPKPTEGQVLCVKCHSVCI